MTEFDTPNAGEWVTPVMGGYLMACCDCGLVHRMDFRVIKASARRRGYKLRKADRVSHVQGAAYKVQFRAYRHELPVYA